MTAALRFRYQTLEIGATDIHLRTLRDNQQFSDPNDVALNLGISSASWPIFGVLWPSSLVLANHMDDFKTEGKRILEIGCGIGLSSLLLNAQKMDITATDYHPEVEGFLNNNTALNNHREIDFERIDWADDNSQMGKFDLIIGSDLLYEDEHVSLLAQFIQKHAKQHCEVVIVDPGRGRKNKLTQKLALSGFTCQQTKPLHTDYLTEKFKGYILSYSRLI